MKTAFWVANVSLLVGVCVVVWSIMEDSIFYFVFSFKEVTNVQCRKNWNADIWRQQNHLFSCELTSRSGVCGVNEIDSANRCYACVVDVVSYSGYFSCDGNLVLGLGDRLIPISREKGCAWTKGIDLCVRIEKSAILPQCRLRPRRSRERHPASRD